MFGCYRHVMFLKYNFPKINFEELGFEKGIEKINLFRSVISANANMWHMDDIYREFFRCFGAKIKQERIALRVVSALGITYSKYTNLSKI